MKNLGKVLVILIVLLVAGPILLVMLGGIMALPMLGLNVGMRWMPTLVTGPLLFVAVVCVILLFAFLALKALGSATSGDGEALSADEVKLMQDLNSGLTRLEERVESLETLLLDNQRAADARRRSGPDRAHRTEDGQ